MQPNKRLPHWSGLLFCAVAIGVFAAPSQANQNGTGGGELWNQFVPPNGNPVGFEVDFSGDLTSTIPAQVTQDMGTNPFYALSLLPGEPAANPTTVTYDSGAMITRVLFSGGALPSTLPGNWPIAPYNGTFHFGINGGSSVPSIAPLLPIQSASQHWIYSGGTLQLPVLTVAWDGIFKKKTLDDQLWAAVFTETKDLSAGSWQFAPYLPNKHGGPIKFLITNGGTTPVVIGNTGYELGFVPPRNKECRKSPQCKANQKALDSLNDQSFPAPGENGSTFISVKTPKGALAPGESFEFKTE